MTAPQHYKRAEALIDAAWVSFKNPELRNARLAAARVHATLALTAATAQAAMWNGSGPDPVGLPPNEHEAWSEVLS